MTDIINQLTAYAEAQGWAYVVGMKEAMSINTSMLKLEPAQPVLCVGLPRGITFPIENAFSSRERMTIDIFLFRKNELTGSVSSISETTLQKIDNRMYELYDLLRVCYKTIFENTRSSIIVLSNSIEFEQNATAANMDGVYLSVSFETLQGC